MQDARIIAIDWSGRSGTDQKQALRLAEAVDGQLVRLEGGRTRAEIVELLIEEADARPNLIVGFDFAFSLPSWYLRDRALTPRGLWEALADEALTPTMRRLGLARWVNTPEPPFWTTGEAHSLLAPEQQFRRTETDAATRARSRSPSFSLSARARSAEARCTGCRRSTGWLPPAFASGPSTRPGYPWWWRSSPGC